MNFLIFIITCLSVLFFSCSTISNKQGLKITPLNSFQLVNANKTPEEVEQNLNVILNENPQNPATKWWVKYKRAQIHQASNPAKSCEIYTDLSSIEDFPLYHLAELRSYEICPNSERTRGIFNIKLTKEETWLEDYQEELAYKKAKEINDQEQIMHYALLKSKKSLVYHEKVAFTEEAIAAAKKLKNLDQQKVLEKRLYSLAPRKMPTYARGDWLKVAYDFRRERDFGKAITYYKKVLNHKSSTYTEKKRAFMGIIKVYKLQNDTRLYVLASNQWADFAKRTYNQNKKSNYYQKELVYTNLNVARTLWTKSQTSAARKLLEETVSLLKGKQSLQEVYWILARMEEEKENYSEAVRLAQLAFAEEKVSQDLIDKVLWQKAWNTKKLGKLDEAVEAFRLLLANTEEPHLKNQYKYWQGNILKQLNREREAKELFTELTKEDPFGYYGHLAYAHLDIKIPHLRGSNKLNLNDKHLIASKSKESTLQWLIALNELDAAKHFLKNLDFSDMKQKEKIKYLSYYKLAKDYRGMFVRMATFESEERNEILVIDPEFFFPRPFYDLVEESADKYGVSAEYLLSIIRQESAFDPMARSHADAYGLMQVLPREAFRIAAKENIPLHKTEDLYEPHLNIPIGTAHIKTLRERFDNQFIVSVASYNAAYTAVHGWLNTRYKGDPIAFIEDIPYAETKGYVKLIFRNYMVYKRLNHSVESIPFPHWAFDTLDNYAKGYAGKL